MEEQPDQHIIHKNLNAVFDAAEEIDIDQQNKLVIFSDLHMGDGSSSDDFKRNATLFSTALKSYYQKKGFGVILNGDVEELQKFPIAKISDVWAEIFTIFDSLAEENKLYKTVGNHDLNLAFLSPEIRRYQIFESLKLNYHGNHLFIFHGHQASKKYQSHNQLVGLTLKYLANPLGIKNYSVAHSSRKQYKIEKRVYEYSAMKKIVSIIGHTHRPLFESMHKVERIRFKIEELCREYVRVGEKKSKEIAQMISVLKKDIHLQMTEIDNQPQKYIYNPAFHVPCLFNSGCVIGKRGMTCLEIENGNISLIHWFDQQISRKYLQNTGYEPEEISNSGFYRMVINKESLDYIFARIKFLA